MEFYKYQGTGNDFVMLDGRTEKISLSSEEILKICHRRFGIGADGLIILKPHPTLDFEMDYYNADGTQSFCGNGSRCAQAFARKLGMIEDQSNFLAIDGEHQGKYDGYWYATKMEQFSPVQSIGDDFFVDTGSPHYIRFVDDIEKVDILKEAHEIRYNDTYKKQGVNVNFVSLGSDALQVRTYERGVEGETFSCGTGVTAVAMAYLVKANINPDEVKILTKGGELSIKLKRTDDTRFEDIWLCGPAEEVFHGDL